MHISTSATKVEAVECNSILEPAEGKWQNWT